jgi:cytochrome P450
MLPSLQQQAVGLIDPIAAKGECEVMADIAIPYPSQVFLTLFGLPLEDRDRLIAWKDAVINMDLTATPDGVDLTPAVELFTYISEAVTKHRQSPGADLLSQVLSGDDPLVDPEGAWAICSCWPGWTPSPRRSGPRCSSWPADPTYRCTCVRIPPT